MATSHSNPNPPTAIDQEAADGDYLSPQSVEETLCGRMRKLREDELFEAMDCMGGGEAPQPVDKTEINTKNSNDQREQADMQAGRQVRRARGF